MTQKSVTFWEDTKMVRKAELEKFLSFSGSCIYVALSFYHRGRVILHTLTSPT
jgi:hypothetical protein